MLRRLIALILFALLVSPAARAQTYSLNNQTNLVFGGFTVSISGCSYQVATVTQSSCSGDNVDFTATESRGSLSINFFNATNSGSAILSQATGTGCTCVQYALSITSNYAISSAVVADTGTNTTGATVDNWMQFTSLSGSPRIDAMITQGQTSANNSYTVPGSTTSLSISSSLGLNDAYQANVLSLNSAGLTFVSTLEPASLALLLVAAGGVMVAHRQRPRR